MVLAVMYQCFDYFVIRALAVAKAARKTTSDFALLLLLLLPLQLSSPHVPQAPLAAPTVGETNLVQGPHELLLHT